MSKEKDELDKLVGQFPNTRWQFEMHVEAAALEVIDIAKQISGAIGEISLDEAKDAIIREFAERVRK
jgi:hypothetical protein